jgi:hypothetical protein
MMETIEEVWKEIPEFPNYMISSFGRVYNRRRDKIMNTSLTNHGHTKITLKSEYGGDRHTRSVALLVGEAFVHKPNPLCDQLILLDGDLSNAIADNMAWRPRWFAWKYRRQLLTEQPRHFHNLTVINKTAGIQYESIIECGMREGLLFEDIWTSCNTGRVVFPNRHIFEVV